MSEQEADALEELRHQVTELTRALEHLGGGVDALVVDDPDHEDRAMVLTMAGADKPYRVILEHMGEGALTVSGSGVVLYANPRIADFLGLPADAVVGRDVVDLVPVEQLPELTRVLTDTSGATRRCELSLPTASGRPVPCLVSATDLPMDGMTLRCLVFTDLSMQKLVERQVASDAARHERQQVAIEVNDTIVQGLVAAEMALDLGQHEFARRVVARTAGHARHWIGQLAGDGHIEPGSAVRSHPARSGEATP